MKRSLQRRQESPRKRTKREPSLYSCGEGHGRHQGAWSGCPRTLRRRGRGMVRRVSWELERPSVAPSLRGSGSRPVYNRLFQRFRGSFHARSGSGGHSPPTLSITSAISALGERNPNATRVSSRILVLVDSTSPLDSPSVSAAWMLDRWAVIVLASFTNAGMRQRLAHPSHASSSTVARTPLSLNTNRSCSLSR